MTLPVHKTKIVATIGPACRSPQIIEQMILAGMNIARINFSHGDFESHGQVIQNIRAAAEKVGQPVAILADLPGPKMRIGMFAQEPIELKTGAAFTLTTQDIIGDEQHVSVNFSALPHVVKPGDRLFLNDGYVELTVAKVEGTDVLCTVKSGGEVRSKKGLNFPGIDLGISAFTVRDQECLKFALDNGVDAVSQSFVESAADIETVRQAAKELGKTPFIFAKIERINAVERISEILAAADGIMIARGDLGVELPIEQIAVTQKKLIHEANVHAKPVITATQMLESMTYSRRPTRAEATDVSNAILDGTDAVMLSEESATGKYPVEAVGMLARIAATVEPTRKNITIQDIYAGIDLNKKLNPEHLLAVSVESSIDYLDTAAVFARTHSGASARWLAVFKFPVWVIAVSREKKTCQDLLFTYGVLPIHQPAPPQNWSSYIKDWLTQHQVTGTFALLIQRPSEKGEEANHRMEIIERQ